MVLDLVDEGGQFGVGFVDSSAGDDALLHIRGEAGFKRAAGDADDGEVLGQKIGLLQVIERGQEFALGQVAGGAEDDDDAGLGLTLGLRADTVDGRRDVGFVGHCQFTSRALIRLF